jgi:hypothetical protein
METVVGDSWQAPLSSLQSSVAYSEEMKVYLLFDDVMARKKLSGISFFVSCLAHQQ